jgi:hypothetical protein
MRTKILVFHSLDWPTVPRVAIAFRQVGCRVDGLARRGSPLLRLASVDGLHIYHPLAPLASLGTAIARSNPDLVIPCDEPAVQQLLRLWRTTASPPIRAVLEKSLGHPDGYARIATRSNLPAIAAEAGVRLPRTRLATNTAELRDALKEIGFPAVLKANFSWSGNGVGIVRDVGEAESVFARLNGTWARLRAIKCLLRDRDLELLVQRFGDRHPALSIQRVVRGQEANAAIACWRGEIVASLSAQVLVARGVNRNAAVLRIIDNSKMVEAAQRIVRLAGVSGFCGFDFIIEDDTGLPTLIEINPRATQINHLALGPGRDLVAALCSQLAGEPVVDRPAVTDRSEIALFPHEWHRDLQSHYLRSAYHDVPWEEPELVRLNAKPPRPMSDVTVGADATTTGAPLPISICISEDRPSCESAVRILIESLLQTSDRVTLTVFFPPASEEFIRWSSRFGQGTVSIQTSPISEANGWNVKPYVLLRMLESECNEVVWLDSDIVVMKDIKVIFANLSPDTLVITEEALWGAYRDPEGLRCRLWRMQPARDFGFCLNTAVLRVTTRHIPLLKDWCSLLESEAYRSAQASPGTSRQPHLMSDQDALTALLCSEKWKTIPVRVLRRGEEIIQFFGLYGFTGTERIRSLWHGLPTFIHSQGVKPWLARSRRRGLRGWLDTVYLDVSPYTLAVLLRHPNCAEQWAAPMTVLGRVFRAIGLRSIPLTGFPLALGFDITRGLISTIRSFR